MKLNKSMIASNFDELVDFLNSDENEIIILTNDYFYFGNVCKICGDITPEKTKYCYPKYLGDEVDMYELEEDLLDVITEKEIVCENDAVICTCKERKSKKNSYLDDYDDMDENFDDEDY